MATVKLLTKNVETLAEGTQQFNKRNFEAATENLAPDFTYADTAQGTKVTGHKEVIAWLQDWLIAFPDAQATDPVYIDGGDTVVERYAMRGTNDGPLGEFDATGERVDFPVCEIWRFDENGMAISAEMYYDRMTLLQQLGHVQ